jgi:hypothetical protein
MALQGERIRMSIKAIWAAFKVWRFFKEAVKDAKKETKTMNEIKAGWKTSEFWLTVFTSAGTLVGQIQGVIPEPWGAVIAAVCTMGYTIARAFVKKDA